MLQNTLNWTLMLQNTLNPTLMLQYTLYSSELGSLSLYSNERKWLERKFWLRILFDVDFKNFLYLYRFMHSSKEVVGGICFKCNHSAESWFTCCLSLKIWDFYAGRYLYLYLVEYKNGLAHCCSLNLREEEADWVSIYATYDWQPAST